MNIECTLNDESVTVVGLETSQIVGYFYAYYVNSSNVFKRIILTESEVIATGASIAASSGGSTGDSTLADDKSYYGSTISEAVGEDVVFGQCLYFDLSEDEWKLSDADAIGTMPVEGMALESKGNGETCLILKEGKVRDDSWSWTVDDTVKVLYASVTAGEMSETAVVGSLEYSQVVASIRGATKIFFRPEIGMAQVKEA